MSESIVAVGSSLKEIQKVASTVGTEGAAATLIAFGIVLTLLDVGGQVIEEFDRNLILPPVEFVAVLAVSVLALLGGAAVRVYVFKREIDLDEAIAGKKRGPV